MYFYIKLI